MPDARESRHRRGCKGIGGLQAASSEAMVLQELRGTTTAGHRRTVKSGNTDVYSEEDGQQQPKLLGLEAGEKRE